MADPELSSRIEELRSDFTTECGQPFEHFYCPILMRDEPADLCRGHIINEALGACNEWVPQRRDVDSFFGSAVEADFVAMLQHHGKDLDRILRDVKPTRKLRPKLMAEEREIGHYFPKQGSPPVEGHSKVGVIDGSDNLVCNLAVKMSTEELLADGLNLAFVIDADFRSEVIASMIKATHLTLFKMLGYKYVFSPSGMYLAHILRQFYEEHKPPAKCRPEDVSRYFLPLQRMVLPLQHLTDAMKGTVVDNQLISHCGQSGGVFALGVIVRAGDDAFCVFVPGMERYIDTYFSFLKEPPPSVAAKTTKYVPGNGAHEGRWEIPPGEPIRIAIPPLESGGTGVEANE